MTDNLSNKAIRKDWCAFANEHGIPSDVEDIALTFFAVPIGALKLRAKEENERAQQVIIALEAEAAELARDLGNARRSEEAALHRLKETTRAVREWNATGILYTHVSFITAFVVGVLIGGW